MKLKIGMTFENFNDMELYIDNQLNYTLNLVYLLLYKFPDYTTKDFKKDSINEFIPKNINVFKSCKKLLLKI